MFREAAEKDRTVVSDLPIVPRQHRVVSDSPAFSVRFFGPKSSDRDAFRRFRAALYGGTLWYSVKKQQQELRCISSPRLRFRQEVVWRLQRGRKKKKDPTSFFWNYDHRHEQSVFGQFSRVRDTLLEPVCATLVSFFFSSPVSLCSLPFLPVPCSLGNPKWTKFLKVQKLLSQV